VRAGGDRIAHDIIHRLNGGGGGRRAPFSAADGYALATALDDIVDYAEQAADTLGIYGVEATMEQAQEMAAALVEAGDQVAHALETLCSDGDTAPFLVEIHRWRTRATASAATPSPRSSATASTRWS
jgi:uncharacterized protein